MGLRYRAFNISKLVILRPDPNWSPIIHPLINHIFCDLPLRRIVPTWSINIHLHWTPSISLSSPQILSLLYLLLVIEIMRIHYIISVLGEEAVLEPTVTLFTYRSQIRGSVHCVIKMVSVWPQILVVNWISYAFGVILRDWLYSVICSTDQSSILTSNLTIILSLN